jgi:hypothetical protein
MSMRTIYALAFICASFQASAFDLGTSACDLDALNAATTIDSYDYVGTVTQPAIPSEDESMDSTVDYGSLENTWGTDATGSIPEVDYSDRLDETIDEPFFAY